MSADRVVVQRARSILDKARVPNYKIPDHTQCNICPAVVRSAIFVDLNHGKDQLNHGQRATNVVIECEKDALLSRPSARKYTEEVTIECGSVSTDRKFPECPNPPVTVQVTRR